MLVLAAVIAVIPVVVCVFTAFKTEEEYQTTSALTLPKSFLYFENFKVAFTQANMLRGFFNTALVLVVVLAASVLVSSMIAYVLNRFKFVGNGFIRNLFMFAALLPGMNRRSSTAVPILVYFLKSFCRS